MKKTIKVKIFGNHRLNELFQSFSGLSKQKLVAIYLVVLIVTLIVILVSGNWEANDDVLVFFEKTKLINEGLIPYKDFSFGLPPFALPFLMLPAFLTADPYLYSILFALQNIAFSALALYLLMGLTDRGAMDRGKVFVLYLVLVFIYLPDTLKKLDIVPMTFVVAAVYLYLEKRSGLGYLLLLIGTLIKIYPIIFLPLFLFMDLLNARTRNWRGVRTCVCLIFGLILALAFFLLFTSLTLADLNSFVTGQLARGFQIESLTGVIIQALALLGLTTINIVPMAHTFDVSGPLSDTLLPLWPYIFVLALLVTFVLIAHNIRKKGLRQRCSEKLAQINAYMLILLIIFMLTNKVFSTQYMIWIYPMLVIMSLSPYSQYSNHALVLTLVAVIMSKAIIVVGHFGEAFVLVNMVRDVTLVLLLILALKILRKDIKLQSEEETSIGPIDQKR